MYTRLVCSSVVRSMDEALGSIPRHKKSTEVAFTSPVMEHVVKHVQTLLGTILHMSATVLSRPEST